jgi:hypothetical protein
MEKKLPSNKNFDLSFGIFYGLNYLQHYYGLRTTEVFRRLTKLKAKSLNLKKYFNKNEMNQVRMLIHLLVSKNNKPLNQIIIEYKNQRLKKALKLDNKSRHKQKGFDKIGKTKI